MDSGHHEASSSTSIVDCCGGWTSAHAICLKGLVDSLGALSHGPAFVYFSPDPIKMHLTQLHSHAHTVTNPTTNQKLHFAHLIARFTIRIPGCRKIQDFLAFGDPEKYIFIFWSIETLLIPFSDSRRHQFQLRNSTASICIETF